MATRRRRTMMCRCQWINVAVLGLNVALTALKLWGGV